MKKKQPPPAAPHMGRPKVYGDRVAISNIGIERSLLQAADAYAAQQGMNRSQVVAEALRKLLRIR